MSEFPFPFFGAGEARYYMWAEVHVRFEREPTSYQRTAIESSCPGPLQDTIDWSEGRQLVVASGLFLHGALARAYPAKPGDDDYLGDDGWFYAAVSRVERFNAAIESWLGYANDHCPILMVFRGEDSDSGGTEFSRWHDWSVTQLPRLMPELEPILAESIATRQQTHASHMVRGVMSMARRSRVRSTQAPGSGAPMF